MSPTSKMASSLSSLLGEFRVRYLIRYIGFTIIFAGLINFFLFPFTIFGILFILTAIVFLTVLIRYFKKHIPKYERRGTYLIISLYIWLIFYTLTSNAISLLLSSSFSVIIPIVAIYSFTQIFVFIGLRDFFKSFDREEVQYEKLFSFSFIAFAFVGALRTVHIILAMYPDLPINYYVGTYWTGTSLENLFLIGVGSFFIFLNRLLEGKIKVDKEQKDIEEKEEVEKKVICPNCNTPNATRNIHCLECGTKLKEIKEEED
jgi:hypothetical protein